MIKVTSLLREHTHLNPIFKLNFTARVDAYMFKCLTRNIVRLAAVLKSAKDCGFIDPSRCFGMKAAAQRKIIKNQNISDSEGEKGPYLKRLMRSNISSLVTCGYFFCSLRASMVC